MKKRRRECKEIYESGFNRVVACDRWGDVYTNDKDLGVLGDSENNSKIVLDSS